MDDITTVRDLKRALRKAEMVFVQVRFGCSERWVRIAKSEAAELVKGLDADSTPDRAEMYTGTFGSVDAGALYLG